MSPEEFVEFVKKDCKEKGVRLHLPESKYVVMDRTRVSGYFTDNPPVLAVAMNREFMEWFPTLVHEYCHMLQWYEGARVWENAGKSEFLWPWLAKKRSLTAKQAKQMALWAMSVELDCERRVVKMIRRHKLPLDLKWYCRQANAYIYFYHLVYLHRRWYEVGKEPYNTPEIVDSMPAHLWGNHRRISAKRVALYEKCLGWA